MSSPLQEYIDSADNTRSKLAAASFRDENLKIVITPIESNPVNLTIYVDNSYIYVNQAQARRLIFALNHIFGLGQDIK